MEKKQLLVRGWPTLVSLYRHIALNFDTAAKVQICSVRVGFSISSTTQLNSNTIDSRYLDCAYFEIKICSLYKQGTKQVTKYRGKEQFLIFSTIFLFNISLTSGVICDLICFFCFFFLNSSNLICIGMDIWKYFRVPWASR